MKKIILSIITCSLFHMGFGQLNIGSDAKWITTGNASAVLQDMNLVNNGTISAGTGSFKFTGTQNTNVSGFTILSFNTVEIAKANNAKLLLNRNINVGSSINFISGQLDLNGNNILLSTGANIAGETETNRVVGANGGFVEITQNLNSPNGSNPGSLGAFITTSANLGSVTIRRGHTPQSGTGLTGSINRYYSIIPTNNSNLNATLRLKYFDAELNGQNENSMVLYQSTNSGANWNNLSRTTNSINSNYVEKTALASLALQTLANDNTVAGAVTGLTFTGTRKKATEVQLNWTSQTEINMNKYQVQRKLDNETDYTDRASVTSLAPNGNSNSPLTYQNIDANAYTGLSYYRLKIIDKNNVVSYSNIISVAGKTKNVKGVGNNNLVLVADEETATTKSISATSSLITKKITVGPNPNNGNFWFTVNGIEKETIATLYTIDGKQISQFRVVNLQQQKVSNIRTGIYLLKIPGFETQKIIVNGGGNAAPQSIQTNSNSKL
jgi:hypothetical protein